MSEREEVKIRRYDACEMDYIAERENGDYVKYEDHIAALTTAERERDEARERLRLANIDWANCAAAAADHRAEADTLRHRAERAERVVEAARAWLADLWRGDLNGTVIGVCMEYEPDGQYALWEQVAPIAEAVRALDASGRGES